MSTQKIRHYIQDVKVGDKIAVSFFVFPNLSVTTEIGTCITRTPNGKIIMHYEGYATTYPLPPDDENINVTSLDIVQLASILKPISLSNRELPADSTLHVYCDGGASPSSGGPAASAIAVRFVNDNKVEHEEAHARFYPSTTNNLAEFSGVIAALRMSLRHRERSPVIVTDSKLVYDIITGQAKCHQQRLQPFVSEAHDLWRLAVNFATLALMRRSHGNPADELCVKAKRTAAHQGEHIMFPELPVVTNSKLQSKQMLTPISISNLQPLQIKSLEDFVAMRKLSTRSSVPTLAKLHWSTQVKLSLTKIFTASTQEEQEHAIIQFLLLPTRFLPANASSKRVVAHLSAGTPFAISLINRVQGTERRHDSKHHRLIEAVQRLANDKKLRSANKLIFQNSKMQDMPFEKKSQLLEEKINFTPSNAQCVKQDVPLFTGAEVIKSLSSINRQAACAIDGWTKDLLQSAIESNSTIADDYAMLAHHIITQPMSPFLSDIIRAARFVAIPKDEHSIRPIAISNLLLKIAGSISMQRDAKRTTPDQYAVNVKDGCFKILHGLRDQLSDDSGQVIIKFDIRNAFNALDRTYAAEAIAHHDVALKMYFNLVYGAASPMITYGPDSFKIIPMPNGIRQGDSTSTYIFAHTIDKALIKVSSCFRCWMYVDDLTIVTSAATVGYAIDFVNGAFAELGLHLNPEKTRAYSRAACVLPCPIAVHNKDEFKLLGTDLSETQGFIQQQIDKQAKYFDVLNSLQLPPALLFKLLMICGMPRIKYLCSTLQPEYVRPLCEFFDGSTSKIINALIVVFVLPIFLDLLFFLKID